MIGPTIEDIKTWLKATGRSREWLGQQTDSHKRTVDNWLSAGQAIPETKLALIKRLMADDEAAEAQRKQQLDPVNQVFSLEIDLPTFRAYSEAARAHRLTLEEWSIAELNAAADEWLHATASQQAALTAAFATSNVLQEESNNEGKNIERQG